MTSWYSCDFPARDFLKHNRAPTNLKLALLTNEMNTSNLPVLYSDLNRAHSEQEYYQLPLKGLYVAAGNFQDKNETIIDAFLKSK